MVFGVFFFVVLNISRILDSSPISVTSTYRGFTYRCSVPPSSEGGSLAPTLSPSQKPTHTVPPSNLPDSAPPRLSGSSGTALHRLGVVVSSARLPQLLPDVVLVQLLGVTDDDLFSKVLQEQEQVMGEMRNMELVGGKH